MTITFLPDVGIYKEAQNERKILTNLVQYVNCRSQSRKIRLLEMKLLEMLTSRNFAALSLTTSKINPENFRSISQRLAILQINLNSEKSLSVKYSTACKCVTWRHQISRHWPSFKSFWLLEVKSAFQKGQTTAQILRDFSEIWFVLIFGLMVTAMKNSFMLREST